MANRRCDGRCCVAESHCGRPPGGARGSCASAVRGRAGSHRSARRRCRCSRRVGVRSAPGVRARAGRTCGVDDRDGQCGRRSAHGGGPRSHRAAGDRRRRSGRASLTRHRNRSAACCVCRFGGWTGVGRAGERPCSHWTDGSSTR